MFPWLCPEVSWMHIWSVWGMDKFLHIKPKIALPLVLSLGLEFSGFSGCGWSRMGPLKCAGICGFNETMWRSGGHHVSGSQTGVLKASITALNKALVPDKYIQCE